MAAAGFVKRAFTAILLSAAGVALASDDPFLWLEERNGAQALAWVTGQNARTAAELRSDPRYESYVDTAFGFFTSGDNLPYGYVQGAYVYNFWQDDEHNLGLWRRTSPASYKTAAPDWETVIDFDALAAAEGTNWVFSYADCLAPDYLRCLVAMSPDGGDALEIREFDLPAKRFVEGGFFSTVSKSGMSWVDADTVALSPAYEASDQTESGYPRRVKLWKRGTPAAQAATIFEADPRDGWTLVYVAGDGAFRDLVVGRGLDFYRSELFVRMAGGEMRQIPLPLDAVIYQHFDGQLVFSLRSAWQAPDGKAYGAGGVYAFDFQDWLKTGKIATIDTLLQPSPRAAVLSTARTRDKLYVSLLDNVRGRILVFDRPGGRWQSLRVALPDNGDVAINHADFSGTSVSFSYTDALTPPSLIWSDDDASTLATIKSDKPRFDASPYVSEQFEARSSDGTMVPYFVVRRKDLPGPAPTLLYGYGGFEASQTPWYSGMRGRLWLDQGNVWALANIRGGGEFGPAWHQAAIKQNRQRAFDDFAAIAEDLARRGLTTPRQLGIVGGSNGGLLTGVLLTQRPELFGAVISEVPLLDMLRYTLLPAGASWIAEYGDPAIPEEAAYLARYSPYNNVRAGTAYPPALFLTSTADDRVHPGHARKMAALMQSQGHDALFYEETQGGHGGGGDLRRQASFYASEYLFLQRELEVGDPRPLAAAAEAESRAAVLDAADVVAPDCRSLDAMQKSAAAAIAISPSQRTQQARLSRLCANGVSKSFDQR